MANNVAIIKEAYLQEDLAAFVSNLWDTYNNQRQEKINEWMELRNYIFATDTTKTTNAKLPWKNKTTIPKICQIRDNLHSNYISALFPNDNWVKWIALSNDAAQKNKAAMIEAYIKNKASLGHLRTAISSLLYDYIDYGNAFAWVDFESSYKTLSNGLKEPKYIGPVVRRISPLDIVFNPKSDSFKESHKIIRSVKTVGELFKLAKTSPDNVFWEQVMKQRETKRNLYGGYRKEDWSKAVGYDVDGFGSYYEYLQSGFVEVLEFYGDYYNPATQELMEDCIITVIDRNTVVRTVQIPNWEGVAQIHHVGWRHRQDNLWYMGPLDNLVGMQYRIDHLENLKADAADLAIHPPLVVAGEVEEFEWGPSAEIHIDENGSITELGKNLNSIIVADNQIQRLQETMEVMAGAPREAMGMRTPGEKTALEVSTLNSAAGRIFQEKITHFEIELLEPVLNSCLETSIRNMVTYDVIMVLDKDYGVRDFMTITKEDITAKGILRPIGARHFSKEAQDLQNLVGLANSNLWSHVTPHVSGIELAKFISDATNLKGYDIFKPNIAVSEQKETQSMVNSAQDMVLQEEAFRGVE